MKITKATHPELWETTISRLSRSVTVHPEKYRKHLDECKKIFAHLSEREQELMAIHIAITHPGFGKSRRLLWILAAIVLAILLLFMATKMHAQDFPLTVIPLDSDAKVSLLKLLRKQDQLLMDKKDAQLKIDRLDKQISGVDDEISKAAQVMATSGHIDTETLVLDLDRLAWVSKENSK